LAVIFRFSRPCAYSFNLAGRHSAVAAERGDRDGHFGFSSTRTRRPGDRIGEVVGRRHLEWECGACARTNARETTAHYVGRVVGFARVRSAVVTRRSSSSAFYPVLTLNRIAGSFSRAPRRTFAICVARNRADVAGRSRFCFCAHTKDPRPRVCSGFCAGFTSERLQRRRALSLADLMWAWCCCRLAPPRLRSSAENFCRIPGGAFRARCFDAPGPRSRRWPSARLFQGMLRIRISRPSSRQIGRAELARTPGAPHNRVHVDLKPLTSDERRRPARFESSRKACRASFEI